jgi:hypothetical protein
MMPNLSSLLRDLLPSGQAFWKERWGGRGRRIRAEEKKKEGRGS